MKKLALTNPSFRYLEKSFKEWLDILGYAPTTVYNLPIHVRELLHHLETAGLQNIKQLEPKHIKAHYQKLKERSHQRRGGGLSASHLNKHIQAIRKFTEYLRKVGRLELAEVYLHQEEAAQKLTFLTEEEIQQLFAATYTDYKSHRYLREAQFRAMQSRDRAMLAVFYGCGLRRNEGVQLNVSDIDFDPDKGPGLLHVRKGKGYKERFVPISKASLKHLTAYIYDHRPVLSLSKKVDPLFLSYRGMRLQGQSLLLRLKYLQYYSDSASLREKEIGLHTLRHSIATHLLRSGMKLESISRFLGHCSLESTQLYTHLVGMETTNSQPHDNIPKYETIQLSEDEY